MLRLRDVRSYFEADESELGERLLGVLLSVGAILSVAGLAAITWVAGWHDVWTSLVHAQWPFLLIAPVPLVISHLGYMLAYREVAKVDGAPAVHGRDMLTIVTTGFGPVSPRGGFKLDAQEFRKRGLSEEQAQLRVRVVGMLEYAVLAPATLVSAAYMMAKGMTAQSGLLPSWVIGVPVGTIVTIALLIWYRRAGRPHWWSPLRNMLEAIEKLLVVLRTWPAGALASFGMALYWASEIAILAACLDVFAHRRGAVAVMIVGYATGYALTRRSLPLGAAGVVEALLPFALTWVGFDLAPAVLAVVAYRLFNLWLAMLPALFGLRRLRRHESHTTRHDKRRDADSTRRAKAATESAVVAPDRR